MGQRILRSGQSFVDLFGKGKRSYEVIEDPIQDDAKIVNAILTFSCASNSDLLVVLESAEWPDTPEGKPIEEIRPTTRMSNPQGVSFDDVLVMLKAVHEVGCYNYKAHICHFCGKPVSQDEHGHYWESHERGCLYLQIEDYLKEIGRL